MFPNLNAEQARKDLSNSDVAKLLGVKSDAYERRKRTGRFSAGECATLCSFFDCSFEYLFSLEPIKNVYPSAPQRGENV